MTDFPVDLLNGYHGFMADGYTRERERYRELAEAGQKPQSLVIACCDSRVAPEVIFNAKPGELFVARNVANLVPPYPLEGAGASMAAIVEFAVQALGVSNIIVLGHGRCGGISAALDTSFKPLSKDDFIGYWISSLEALGSEVNARDDLDPPARQTALERISVRNSINNLKTFPIVAERQAKGALKLYGAWFDISSGELWIMDEENGEFSSMTAHAGGRPTTA
jgi:carbonic anhydrase